MLNFAGVSAGAPFFQQRPWGGGGGAGCTAVPAVQINALQIKVTYVAI